MFFNIVLNIAVYQRLDYRVSQCSLGLDTLALVVRLPGLGLAGLRTVASDLAPSTYKEIRPCFGAKAAGQQLGWHVLSGGTVWQHGPFYSLRFSSSSHLRS